MQGGNDQVKGMSVSSAHTFVVFMTVHSLLEEELLVVVTG